MPPLYRGTVLTMPTESVNGRRGVTCTVPHIRFCFSYRERKSFYVHGSQPGQSHRQPRSKPESAACTKENAPSSYKSAPFFPNCGIVEIQLTVRHSCVNILSISDDPLFYYADTRVSNIFFINNLFVIYLNKHGL